VDGGLWTPTHNLPMPPAKLACQSPKIAFQPQALPGMSDETNSTAEESEKPDPGPRWEWPVHYVLATAFSAWCGSYVGGFMGPIAPYVGAIFGAAFAYLMHRKAKAGRLD